MLKLSKISKVILIVGMLITFSCFANVLTAGYSFAQETNQEGQTKKQQNANNAKNEYTKEKEAWEKAKQEKDKAQQEYTNASKAYNECLSSKGDNCADLKAKMDTAKTNLETKTNVYNDAQKTASDAYYKNEKAQAKANKEAEKAQKKQQKANEKALKDAKKAYEKCLKEQKKDINKKCDSEKTALDNAQKEVDKGIQGSESSVDVSGVSAANVGQAYKTAQAECDKYSAMTSKDAQTKAREACARAKALKTEYDRLKGEEKDSPSTQAAQKHLKKDAVISEWENWDGGAYGGRKLDWGKTASGHDSLAGYRSEYFNYNGANGEVLDTVTRRAALAIVSLKPIIYIFAGFGLIAFAWMAIFNKLSWKWFANIAMGLFLVANMGRLIEYFVAGDGNTHYYIGKWDSATGSTGTATDGQNQLANAFKDSYYVYGDTNYNERGVRNFFNEGASDDVAEEFKASTAGFCQGTSASGWANFKNCMQDIVSSVKKGVNAVKTAKETVEDVVARAEAVKDNVENIVQAAKAMDGASLTDIIANAGTILNNINAAVSTTTGAVASLQNGMSSIANDIQDVTKSRAEQQELNDRRAAGESTNKFNAKLSGQEWNSATGGVENVDGKYAGQSTGWSDLAQGAANFANKTAETNAMLQDLSVTAQGFTNAVENTSVNDLIGDWGQEWGNDTIRDARQRDANERKQKEKAQAQDEERKAYEKQREDEYNAYLETNEGKNANYEQQVQNVDNLYLDIKNQEAEVKHLEEQLKQAQAQAEANCKDGSDTSPMCVASRNVVTSISEQKSAVEEQLKKTQETYEDAKNNAEKAYKDALESNINKAQEDYDKASKEAEDICKKAPSSADCSAARKKVLDAANKVASYTSEKENGTDGMRKDSREENAASEKEAINNAIESIKNQQELDEAEEQLKYEQEQAEYRQNNEAAIAQQEYSEAMDEANTLYNQINAQEKEAKDLEEQAKVKQQEATRICGSNASSQLCTTAQIAASAAKDAADNKKDQLNQSKKQYDEAKSKAETAYNNAISAGVNQAQRDYDKAKAAADQAQKQVADAEAKMDSAKANAETSKKAYESAVSDANKAKNDYDKAVENGASAAEIEELKKEYDAKLKAMSDANKERQKAEAEYNQLKKQKSDAERAYNDAYSKANEAADRGASYTNESVNKTGDSRLNSSEDIYNQALVNQYKSETNPNAVAQASKNSYVEYKNKTDMAKSVMNDAAMAEEQARIAYEEALAAAKASGSEDDQKVADRMKKNYELAQVEAENAKKQYEENSKNLQAYEVDYINKAIASEKYKQEVYNSQMQKASSDINEYEKLVNTQRQAVDAAGDAYIKAKNQASDNNADSVKNAAIKYNEYKAKKEIYDEYVRKLNVAKTSYNTAQSGYQTSLAELDRLEKQLKELKGVSN